MATPAERIDDLDLHLNPPPKSALDFLARQESKPEPEPPSGIHDFSEVTTKPMDVDLSAIPPSAPVLTTESGVASKGSAEVGKEFEEIFPLPKSLVDYINSLSEKSAKKSLLHSMEKMPKSAVKRALSKHYAQHYITEQEYNTAFDLLEGSNRNEVELDTSGLIWPPPKEDLDDIHVIDLQALRGIQPTVDEAKKEKKDAAVLEPAPSVDVSTASETKVIEENIPVPPDVLDDTEVGNITAESFGDLYEKLRQTGGVESTDNLTVEEWIEEIERVRYHPHPELLQEEITTNKGLRNLVFDLITKESATVSINDKHEYQIKDALEREDFELARKEAGEVDDEPRRNKLFELIDEKEKKDRHSDPVEVVVAPHVDTLEQNNELVSGEVKETSEVVKINLDIARENYARAKIEFSKKNTKYNKIKGSLEGLLSGGVLAGRSKEKSPTEIELEEAQKNVDETLSLYIKEKSVKKNDIISSFKHEAERLEKAGAPLTPEQEVEIMGQIKIKLLEQAEKEWDLLYGQTKGLSPGWIQKTIKKIDTIGAVEKASQSEMFQKAVGLWTRQDRVGTAVRFGVRTVIPSVAIALLVGATGGLAVGAMAGGTAFARRATSFTGAAGVGTWRDIKNSDVNTKAREGYQTAYVDDKSLVSSEEREKQYMLAKEEEVKRKKAQQIKKAMLMVGAGAGAGILTGLAESALSSGGAVSAAGSAEAVNKPKMSVSPKASYVDGIRPKPSMSSVTESVPNKQETGTSGIMDKPETKVIPESVKAPVTISATVELSSRGFLEDIHRLKTNILNEYGRDVKKIPEDIRAKFYDRPTIEIAKEHGLYKPGSANESAIGYAGEKLSLDSNGKLIIERVDGTKETLSGLGRESVKVAVPEVETNTRSLGAVERVSPVPVRAEVIETKMIPEADSIVVPTEHVAIPDEPEIIQDTGTVEKVVNHTAFGVSEPGKVNIGLDVIDKAGSKSVVLDGVEIAHEEPFGTGKILALDKKFQEGDQYVGVRKSFAEAFEKNVTVDQVGQNPTRLDFEGGKIYIIQGLKDDPMGMKVLLNGKEIARGSMEVKGSVLGPKLKFDSSLKGGWFLDDNAYERAFKNVKNALSIK